MSRRTTGTILLFISALLYATRHLSAAIFGSGISSWSQELFQAMLINVGKGPVTYSAISLIAGVGYLLWAEVDAIRTRSKRSDEDQRSETNKSGTAMKGMK